MKLGGLLAARTSLIGVMLNEIGLQDPAAYFVDQAQTLAETVQKKAIRTERKLVRDRPLHFTFSRVFEKSDYPTIDPNQLETISFSKRVQASEPDVDDFVVMSFHEIQKISRLKFAYQNAYDSNTIRLADGATPPNGISRKTGSTPTYFASYEAQSDPTRRMSYGGSYNFLSRQKSRTELDPYTATSHLPSGWVSWWNARNLEARIRYDIAFSRHGGSRPETSKRSHGPSLHLIRDFSTRGRARFSLSQVTNTGDSDGRNGTEYFSALDYITRNKDRALEPRIGFAYRRNVALSGLFNSTGTEVRVGTAALIGARTVLDFATTLRWTHFSRSPSSRSDQLRILEFRGVFPMGSSQFSFLGNAIYENQTSSDSSSAFSRWAIGGGFSAALDW